MRIKLLLITGLFPPQRNGVAHYCGKFVSNFSKQNDITVLTTKDHRNVGGKSSTRYDLIRKLTINPVSAFTCIPHIRKEKRIIQLEFPSCDNKLLITFLILSILIRIFSYENSVLRLHEYSERPWSKKNYIKILSILFNKIIVASGVDKQQLSNSLLITKIFNKEIHQIHIGSNIEISRMPINYIIELKKKIGSGFLIGYFGELTYKHNQKGGNQIIAIINNLKFKYGFDNFILVKIGGKDDILSSYRTVHLNLRANIFCTGYLSEDEVSNYIQLCDIFIFPFEDGFKLNRGSLISCLIHKKKILSTRNSFENYPAGIEKYVTFINHNDIDLYCKNILAFVKYENSNIICKDIQFDSTFFDWSTIISLFNNIYKTIL